MYDLTGLFNPYQSGWEANTCGVSLDDNPYTEDTLWSDEWIDGWDTAAGLAKIAAAR